MTPTSSPRPNLVPTSSGRCPNQPRPLVPLVYRTRDEGRGVGGSAERDLVPENLVPFKSKRRTMNTTSLDQPVAAAEMYLAWRVTADNADAVAAWVTGGHVEVDADLTPVVVFPAAGFRGQLRRAGVGDWVVRCAWTGTEYAIRADQFDGRFTIVGTHVNDIEEAS